jgi:hypothetical protein
MVEIPGVDYAWSHPSPASLKAAGKRFAARYSSTDPDKDLTRPEADALAAQGIASVLVRESTAQRAGAGRAAGITDAQAALKTAAACGMPAGRPLYFAVDYDADPTKVVPYFQGVASVIGLARVGVYGGYDVVRYLLDHGLAQWAWQTRAWSAGRWDPRAHIRQGATQTIGGVSCDLNTATTTDYGQWTPRTPDLEDDMPLTTAEKQEIANLAAAAVMKALGAPAGLFASLDDATTSDDSKVTWRGNAWNSTFHAGRADANSVKILAQVAALNATVAAMQKGGGLTAEQITAASEAGARAALAELGTALTTTPKEN